MVHWKTTEVPENFTQNNYKFRSKLHYWYIYISKGKKSMYQRYLHSMFIAAVFTIAKTCKSIPYLSIDERLKKMYYSAIRMNVILSLAATWVN